MEFNKGRRHRLGGRVPEANAEIQPNSYLGRLDILGDIDRLLVAFSMISASTSPGLRSPLLFPPCLSARISMGIRKVAAERS